MVALIALTLFGIHLAAQPSDPIVGTWLLNVARSQFNPGPAPKLESRTYIVVNQETRMTSRGVDGPLTYKAVNQEIKATSVGVDGGGNPIGGEWAVVYDGRDHPVTGDPDADMCSVKRIDAFTTAFIQKRAGKVVITGTETISRDGTVMTITAKGINARGQTIDNVSVFQKQ